MDDFAELLDLVDDNDRIIGAIEREDILKLIDSNGGYIRGVGGFLINSSGLLFIPRRAHHKKIAPNGLDFSADEHVGQGESYEAAMVRGFQEELSLSIDPSQLILVGKVPPFPGLPYFHDIFLYHYDDTPQYDQKEFIGHEWLKPAILHQRLTQGDAAKEILLPATRSVLNYFR